MKVHFYIHCVNLTFFFRFPWNWRNPSGYFEAIFLQTLWLILITLTISCELSLFVRFFILLGALAKDIVAKIKDYGNTFPNENVEPEQQITIGERNQMMKKIIELVEFQTEAQEFVSICGQDQDFKLI